MSNFRKHAKKHYKFLGNILAFNPHDYSNTIEMKSKLGYGKGPLIICSVGGTAIGVDLLNLCSRTYKILKDKLPGLQMVLICGPRIDPDSIITTEGVQIKGYVPKLYEHYEQKLVSDKLERLGGGVKMNFSETDESTLSKAVLENLGKKVDHSKVNIDRAEKAAEFIQELL